MHLENKSVNLKNIVGKGYKTFWNFKGRYRVVKGGRGSKKSTTACIWIIYNMMKYYHMYNLKPNTLVLRRFYYTHKDSTFAQLKRAINYLNVGHKWKTTISPLEMIYEPSGQKILFRGLDEPESITSITVEDGHLCWTLWEEAYQIVKEDDFNKVDLSIRGKIPHPLFKQHTLILNPWSEKTWIKKRFFDKPDDETLALTRNYDCNEFLDKADIKIFETMKDEYPRRYSIEGLGNWGISTGLVFPRHKIEQFDFCDMIQTTYCSGNPNYKMLNGLDFGFTNDPTAFIATLCDIKKKTIYVYDEIYGYGMTNQEIYDAICYKGFRKSKIKADCADTRTISELKILGLARIKACKKGKGSVRATIQKLQDYLIIIHPRCANAIVEIQNYVWEKQNKTGEVLNQPIDEFNHLMDALRYAVEDLHSKNFTFK